MGDRIISRFMVPSSTTNMGCERAPFSEKERANDRGGLQPVEAQSNSSIPSNINDFCSLLHIIPV
jgi:hypothetical protein